MDVSVIHALPGRLRVHVPAADTGGRHGTPVLLQDMRGVRSVRRSGWTGNLLIHYDIALTDERAILRALQSDVLSARLDLPARSSRSPVDRRSDASRPDPTRVVLPVLHLVYSCSPVGVTLHVGELAWAVGRSAGWVRIALPAAHLALSCHPAGLVLHAGELLWALMPFVVPARAPRTMRPVVAR